MGTLVITKMLFLLRSWEDINNFTENLTSSSSTHDSTSCLIDIHSLCVCNTLCSTQQQTEVHEK